MVWADKAQATITSWLLTKTQQRSSKMQSQTPINKLMRSRWVTDQHLKPCQISLFTNCWTFTHNSALNSLGYSTGIPCFWHWTTLVVLIHKAPTRFNIHGHVYTLWHSKAQKVTTLQCFSLGFGFVNELALHQKHVVPQFILKVNARFMVVLLN